MEQIWMTTTKSIWQNSDISAIYFRPKGKSNTFFGFLSTDLKISLISADLPHFRENERTLVVSPAGFEPWCVLALRYSRIEPQCMVVIFLCYSNLENFQLITKCRESAEKMELNKISLKKAFREQFLRLHPDKNRSPRANEAFVIGQMAFKCLSRDPSRIECKQLLDDMKQKMQIDYFIFWCALMLGFWFLFCLATATGLNGWQVLPTHMDVGKKIDIDRRGGCWNLY